jgi:hypothetical protein
MPFISLSVHDAVGGRGLQTRKLTAISETATRYQMTGARPSSGRGLKKRITTDGINQSTGIGIKSEILLDDKGFE